MTYAITDSIHSLFMIKKFQTVMKIKYRSLGKIRHEKIFVGYQVRRKLNTRNFSYHKEIEQFIMVCSLLRQNFLHRYFSHEYFQPLIFPKLW